MKATDFINLSGDQAVIMTKADIIALAELIAKTRENKMLTMKEAAQAYGCSINTLRSRLAAGIYKGIKDGGVWAVESPASRAYRLTTTN